MPPDPSNPPFLLEPVGAGGLLRRPASSQLPMEAISKTFSACTHENSVGTVSGTPTVNDERCRRARLFRVGARQVSPRRHNSITRRLRAEPSIRRPSSRPALRNGAKRRRYNRQDRAETRLHLVRMSQRPDPARPFRHLIASRMQETACPHQRIPPGTHRGFPTLQGGARCASTP